MPLLLLMRPKCMPSVRTNANAELVRGKGRPSSGSDQHNTNLLAWQSATAVRKPRAFLDWRPPGVRTSPALLPEPQKLTTHVQ